MQCCELSFPLVKINPLKGIIHKLISENSSTIINERLKNISDKMMETESLLNNINLSSLHQVKLRKFQDLN